MLDVPNDCKDDVKRAGEQKKGLSCWVNKLPL